MAQFLLTMSSAITHALPGAPNWFCSRVVTYHAPSATLLYGSASRIVPVTIHVDSRPSPRTAFDIGRQPARVSSLTASQSSSRLLVGCSDGCAQLWDIPTRSLVASHQLHGKVRSRSRRYLVISCQQDCNSFPHAVLSRSNSVVQCGYACVVFRLINI